MIIETLRSSTKMAHLELDHMLYPKIQAINCKEEYIKLLTLFYGYVKPVQDNIDIYLNDDLVFNYSGRRKPDRILDDIRSISRDQPAFLYCNNLPGITNSPEAFGAFYVIEGSSLGGAIISKTITKNLRFYNGKSLSYFTAYGNENHTMWNSFLLSLEQNESNYTHLDLLINCAQNTFTEFKNWLTNYYGRN